MYKLFIAEDDANILSSLQNSIDWASLGFRVCGCASSGTVAYQWALVNQPDVLLTDMVMPGMTGLELVEKLHEANLQIKFVFLSAYDDFKYVHPSFRLGAVDYLLKPLHVDKLCDVFRSLYQQLEEEKSTRSKNERNTKLLQVSRRELPRQILLDYILGQQSDEQLMSFAMEHFGLLPESRLFFAAVRFPGHSDPEQISGVMEQHFSYDAKRPILISLQIQYLLLFPDDADPAAVLTSVLSDDVAYQCIVSEKVPFSALPELYRRIYGNRTLWFYTPMNRIVSAGSLCVPQSDDQAAPPGAQELYDRIKASDTAGVKHILDSFLSACKAGFVSSDMVSIHMAELYSKVVGLLQVVQPKLEADGFESLYVMLQKQPCYDLFHHTLTEKYEELLIRFAELCAVKGDLIDKVQTYIQLHFTEDLTLSSLAEEFYVSPSYLSALFSKRTDLTITKYLQNIRLEKATQLLIRNDLTVAQVGSAIGYASYPHFCRLFKRQFGLTPTDFRLQHR